MAVSEPIFAVLERQPRASAPRYDSYLAIHKALRALLTDTLVKLGALDPEDDASVQQALSQTRQAIGLSQSHLAKEDAFVHPAMEARAPGSTRRAAADHDEHEERFAAILAACNEVETAQGPRRAELALCLYRRFALFFAEDLIHMNAEETENNAVLWATYSDAEIHALIDKLLASIPPPTMAQYLPWMIAANTPADRIEILNGVRGKMPAPAFKGLLDGVLPVLSPADQAKLVRALG